VIAVAIGLAVAGACCYAVAAWLQQSAVHAATGGGGALRLDGWARVLRAPRWVTGFGLTAVGAALHAGALSMAPLVTVQPVGVLAIALTTVLAGRSTGVGLTRATGLAVVACIVGVGAFVTLAATSAASAPVPAGAEWRATLIVGLLVAVAAGIGLVARKRARCVGFASAAGLSYGLVSVLVHATAVRVESGGLGQISVTSVAGVIVALLVGGWFVQHAYAAGPPQVVVACLTVLDPLLGVGVGVGLLGETTLVTPITAIGLAVGAVLAALGVILLSRRSVFPPSAVERFVTRTSVEPGPLRIVIGADTFPPDINGASHFGDRLARGLVARGHDVHVLCPATDARDTTETQDGVTLHRVASRRTPFHPTFRICLPWHAFRAAQSVVDRIQPDVVHVQAHFLLGRGLVRAAESGGIPLVATNHFMPENLYGHARIPDWLRTAAARFGWWDLYRIFRHAQVVTAPTPRAVALLVEHGLPEALAVSCGIDLNHFGHEHPAPSRPAGGRQVLFVGRLDEEKRVDELLRAVAHPVLAETGVEVRIVGDGSCRTAWQDLAMRLGIGERVTFDGFVDDTTLRNAYAHCDVFCMPGVAELQSLATMEAMAAGKPVIAADAMALPHLVHPGHNGWLYPPGDVPALANLLYDLLTDSTAVARMGQASLEIIAGHTLDRTLERFEGLYRDAIGGQRPVAPALLGAVVAGT
jgi:glycosyltransferase involved in cell wall biosynthesis